MEPVYEEFLKGLVALCIKHNVAIASDDIEFRGKGMAWLYLRGLRMAL